VSQAQAEKRGFFTIYKPGQGKWLRWSTVGGAALILGIGAYWLGFLEQHLAPLELQWRLIPVGAWILLGGWITFWFVNSPRYAEFLIMTESEMRKVSWPTRREVVNSTKVVILLTFGLGGLLWIVDIFFLGLFGRIGIM
jgi:preprotein translocase subunit SecE